MLEKIPKKRVGLSSLYVSQVSLGTMNFGKQVAIDDAFRILDVAYSSGINSFDTAEMYPSPSDLVTSGESERILGAWLANNRGIDRHSIVLGTKMTGPSPKLNHIRSGNTAYKRREVQCAIEGSLERLCTDFIDIYYLHWPVRSVNNFGRRSFQDLLMDTNSDEVHEQMLSVLEVLDSYCKKGLIREIGISNETTWGLMKYLWLSEKNNFKKISVIQNPYSLLNRICEESLSEACLNENIGYFGYSPLGFGVLTGKYLEKNMPTNSRRSLFAGFDRYSSEDSSLATYEYKKLSSKYGLSPIGVSISFLLTKKFLTSTVLGVSSVEQLRQNLTEIFYEFPDCLREEINKIHSHFSSPSP